VAWWGGVGCFWGIFHILIKQEGFFPHVNDYHMNIKVEENLQRGKNKE
jgi:hypothetical protein